MHLGGLTWCLKLVMRQQRENKMTKKSAARKGPTGENVVRSRVLRALGQQLYCLQEKQSSTAGKRTVCKRSRIRATIRISAIRLPGWPRNGLRRRRQEKHNRIIVRSLNLMHACKKPGNCGRGHR
jgi:hypothetical protein